MHIWRTLVSKSVSFPHSFYSLFFFYLYYINDVLLKGHTYCKNSTRAIIVNVNHLRIPPPPPHHNVTFSPLFLKAWPVRIIYCTSPNFIFYLFADSFFFFFKLALYEFLYWQSVGNVSILLPGFWSSTQIDKNTLPEYCLAIYLSLLLKRKVVHSFEENSVWTTIIYHMM